MYHDIINKMMNIISLDVLQKVLSPIHNGFYAILSDETKDIPNKEQLVTLRRWVDDFFEDFKRLFDLPKTDL